MTLFPTNLGPSLEEAELEGRGSLSILCCFIKENSQNLGPTTGKWPHGQVLANYLAGVGAMGALSWGPIPGAGRSPTSAVVTVVDLGNRQLQGAGRDAGYLDFVRGSLFIQLPLKTLHGEGL